MLFVDEFDLLLIRLVKYDPHDGLASSNWTVYLRVDLVYRYGLPLSYECIEHIFTKLFSLNNHFLGLRVQLRIEGR